VPRVPVKLVSWDEIVEWSLGLGKVIESSGWTPDMVVAVARGGYVPRGSCATTLASRTW